MPEAPAPPVDDPPPSDPKQLVDAALTVLARIEQRPVAEHVAVFDHVHRALQDALATLDQV